ncbi:hypothetical protein K438DRAFT_1830924 [Mycena galopus ATCC 62051]|nr:hypothetical protein K438DRAFT_1830924 [Mycena galopus ATCC 62051]
MDYPIPTSNSTLGAPLIGVLLSYVLFGVTTTQVYIYYGRFPNDSPKLKFLVAFVWLLEVANGICIGQSLYQCLISDYSRPDQLAYVPQSLLVSSLLAVVIAFCVHGFFSFRIYTLSKLAYIPTFISIFAVLRLGLAIFLLAWSGRHVTVLDITGKAGWVLVVIWGTSSTAELLIATTMVYTLYHQSTDLSGRTVELVNKIIKWTIETGILLSATTTLTLILFLAMRDNYIWLAVYVVQAKLYSNSLLASLNSRATLRAMNEIPVSFSAPQVDATPNPLRVDATPDMEMSKFPRTSEN